MRTLDSTRSLSLALFFTHSHYNLFLLLHLCNCNCVCCCCCCCCCFRCICLCVRLLLPVWWCFCLPPNPKLASNVNIEMACVQWNTNLFWLLLDGKNICSVGRACRSLTDRLVRSGLSAPCIHRQCVCVCCAMSRTYVFWHWTLTVCLCLYVSVAMHRRIPCHDGEPHARFACVCVLCCVLYVYFVVIRWKLTTWAAYCVALHSCTNSLGTSHVWQLVAVMNAFNVWARMRAMSSVALGRQARI